jgi:hypothetical protein
MTPEEAPILPEQCSGIAKVVEFVQRERPDLGRVKHRWCQRCDEAHAKSPRQYAHAEGCFNDTICWAHLVARLANEHQIGICLHEYGHIINPGSSGDSVADLEMKADQAVLEAFGIEIQYVGPRELQWVDLEVLENA